jgi:hypothetical protein
MGPPRWYRRGRRRAIQVIFVHTTQGSEGYTSAEGGVAYDKRRPDSVSCHCFADADSVPEEVRDTDEAFHARDKGNAMGWGLELCGLAQQTPGQWGDDVSVRTLRNAAEECAERVLKWGWSPSSVRRLTVPQVRAAFYAPAGLRPFGFAGHIDATEAFPEDGGSHWDPGPSFPWGSWLRQVSTLAWPVPTLEDGMGSYVYKVEGGKDFWISDGLRRRAIPAGGVRGVIMTAGAAVYLGAQSGDRAGYVSPIEGLTVTETEVAYGGPVDVELGGSGDGGVTPAGARAIAVDVVAQSTIKPPGLD